jgi:hypothetical protein
VIEIFIPDFKIISMNVTDSQITEVSHLMFQLDERKAVATAVADLFALGCWLHASGHKEAGLKAVETSLQAVNLDRTNKQLFLAVVDGLAGNEYRFSAAIEAHAEINALLQY